MRQPMQQEPSQRAFDCATLLEAVADREGVDPTNLEPKLYDVVDPDSLEALLRSDSSSTRSPISVEFEYAGYDVVVRSDGTMDVA